MLAKLTSENQLTLPKEVMPDLEGAEYLEVVKENSRIAPTPVRVARADAVRTKLAELGFLDALNANGSARLTFATEVHDPRRRVASFTGKYAASRR